MVNTEGRAPERHLTSFDAVSIVLGVVIGAGIFRSPNLVAGNTGDGTLMTLAWVAGALLCLCGALSYAELASAYPHAGGEYVFLSRAFRPAAGFLFVWARTTVMQTGSIAAVAYIFGDYASAVLPLGNLSSTWYALVAVALLTLANALRFEVGRWTQNLLTVAKVLGLLGIGASALLVAGHGVDASPATPAATTGSFGLAMVFVLYTYGGWNEAAYLAGEVRDAPRKMTWILLASIGTLAVLYVGVNLAYLRVLGMDGMAGSSAVAADAMEKAFGPGARAAVSVLVALCALGAINGCIFTGARAIWAAGSDHSLFRALGRWHGARQTPVNAILVQGLVTILLVLFAAIGRDYRKGFENVVEYTAPVFWTFLLLTAVSVFVLRVKDRDVPRPFRAPAFVVTLFALMCGYMLYSSLAYTGAHALVGMGVLLAGLPFYAFCRRK